VLLKNSIVRTPPSPGEVENPIPDVNSVYSYDDEGDGDDEDDGVEEEIDSFMFPDASNLVDCGGTDVNVSEAEWLDSLLETLGEDGEDLDAQIHVSVSPVEDDEDMQTSPLVSPMSSSDDLPNQFAYCSPPIAVPYPVPYPPFHPPLIRPCELGPIIDSPIVSSLPAYDDPLPYYDTDEIDDLSVPDAIEDTSDDESDVPSTPSLVCSSTLSFVDPASVPLPAERRRQRLQPHVYIGTTDPYFYPFEIDPLPFSDEDRFASYNPIYSEC